MNGATSEVPVRPLPLLRAAWITATVSGGTTLLLAVVNRETGDQGIVVSAGAYAIVLSSIGWWIHRTVRHAVGTVYLVGGSLAGVGGLMSGYASYGLLTDPGSLPWAAYAVIGVLLLLPGLALPLVVGTLLVPDGTFRSARWRAVGIASVGAMVCFMLFSSARPGAIPEYGLAENPIGLDVAAGFAEPMSGASIVVIVLCALAALASIVIRRHGADPSERQQLDVVVAGVVTTIVGVVVAQYVADGAWVHIAAQSALPISVGVAIVRYRLWVVDSLINRTVVYSAVSIVLAGIYIGATAALGAPLGGRAQVGASLVATGCVAAALQPVRAAAERITERYLFGRRGTPYDVVRDLSTRIDRAGTSSSLETLVGGIGEALKLPHVRIELHGGPTPAAAVGTPHPGREHPFPISHHGVELGLLVVATRSAHEPLTDTEVGLLAHLAQQSGSLLHSLALSSALERSQQQLISAREAERQRVRHDLHDGVGPNLAAVLLDLSDAQDLLTDAPEPVRDALSRASANTRATVGEIRRIVRDLRPEELDQLGLLDAIGAQAQRLTTGGLTITVRSTSPLHDLPPAVEVAAFSVAREAITNVVRHAAASQCDVVVSVDDGLVLEVHDDGIGRDPRTSDGVGLRSMRRRVEELGGTWSIGDGPVGGTTVRAHFPAAAR